MWLLRILKMSWTTKIVRSRNEKGSRNNQVVSEWNKKRVGNLLLTHNQKRGIGTSYHNWPKRVNAKHKKSKTEDFGQACSLVGFRENESYNINSKRLLGLGKTGLQVLWCRTYDDDEVAIVMKAKFVILSIFSYECHIFFVLCATAKTYYFDGLPVVVSLRSTYFFFYTFWIFSEW